MAATTLLLLLSSSMALFSPEIVTLANELQLIAVERPYGKVFAMALAIRAGSFDDPPGLPGMAHFCEHLAFRGANQELDEKLDSLGVDANAHTGLEYTLFRIWGHVAHLELALRFIANVLQCTPRTQEDIAAEQDVFRHELKDEEPSDREDAWDRFRRAALGDPNWRLTHDEHVTKIKRLTADVVNPFFLTHYQPANARLALVAPIDVEKLRRSLEELLPRPRLAQQQSVPAQNDEPPAPCRTRYLQSLKWTGSGKARSAPRRLTTNFDPFGYIWIKCIYVIDRTDAVTRLAAIAIANRLGDGPHSELFRCIRMEEKLAYSVGATYLLQLHRTGIHASISVPRRSVKRALRILLDCENDLRTTGFSADVLDGMKQRIILRKELHLDYPEHLAAHLAFEALRPPAEAWLLPDNYIQRISNLTLTEVNDTARAIFSPANRFTFIAGRVGPFMRRHIRRELR